MADTHRQGYERQEITYRDLRRLMVNPERSYRVLGGCLNPIMNYCLLNDLPPLTTLVVSEVTGKPGDGFTAGSGDLNADRFQVFDFNWYSIFPPTLEELR